MTKSAHELATEVLEALRVARDNSDDTTEIKYYMHAIQSAESLARQVEELEHTIDGLETEIDEIVRVARDNSRGLTEFLMLNFPKEWGLTKAQHIALYSGASAEALVEMVKGNRLTRENESNPTSDGEWA